MPNLSKLADLARARAQEAEAKAEQKKLLEAFQNTEPWVSLQISRAFLSAEIEQLEASVKDEMLDEYKVTNEKKTPCGEIKSFTEIELTDTEAAREWSFTNFRPALKLDEKEFITAIKSDVKKNKVTIPQSLYTVKTDDRAQIKSDLSAFLPQE